MKNLVAFIEINKKNHKSGCIYINDQIKDMSDAYKWFKMNEEYLKKQAKRKDVDYVRCFVKNQYDEIYSHEI